jgi:hypothetical protein
MLSGSTVHHAIVSQDATTSDGFKLESGATKWVFCLPNTDTTSPTQSIASGPRWP